MNTLAGKTAFVTGATHGIGRAIALAFVAEGANVVACGRDEAALASLSTEAGGALLPQKTDVSVESEIEAAVAAAVARFGRLDAAVNAAGTGGRPSFVSQADAGALEEIWRTNVHGVLMCMKHESRVMQRAASGSIVNISSLSGAMPAKTMAAYCASKAAVDMMTRVAALELGPRGVRVNAIAPGAIDTRMTEWMKLPGIGEAIIDETPLGRIGETADLTGMAVYLASDAASFVTGQIFTLDGGASLMRYPDLPALFKNAARPKNPDVGRAVE